MGHSFTDIFLRQRRVWHCRQVLWHLRTRLRFLEMSSAACSECRHGTPKSQGWQTLSKEHFWVHTWACGFFFSLWSELKSLSSSFSARNTPIMYFGRRQLLFLHDFQGWLGSKWTYGCLLSFSTARVHSNFSGELLLLHLLFWQLEKKTSDVAYYSSLHIYIRINRKCVN